MRDLIEATVDAMRRRRLAARRRERLDSLATQIVDYLSTNPKANTDEVVRGVRARAADVREVLQTDGRVRAVPCPPNTSRRARCWDLAEQAAQDVPDGGTNTS